MPDVAFNDHEPQTPTGKTDGQVDGDVQNLINAAQNIVRQGRVALERLLDAVHYAKDLNHNPWDFGLEIDALRQGGLADSEIRWLLCKGFLEHAKELRSRGDCSVRDFTPTKSLSFGKTSCFLLTESGEAFFRHILCGSSPARTEGTGFLKVHDQRGQQLSCRPVWDRDRQELRFDGQIVKRFKVPAPNQEIILATFEEECWPPQIDDPLPPHANLDPKRRLRDTIVSLNRNQKAAILRFFGDGTGQRVCWQSVRRAEPPGMIRQPK